MSDHLQLRSELDRLAFLSEASDVLASSLDYDQTLQRVARLAVPRLADWCAVDLVSGHEIANVVVAHVDPEKVRLARRLRSHHPPNRDDATGVAAVIRTGRPELYATVTDDMLAAGAADAEELALLRELELRSAVIAPLTARGATLGAITLVRSEAGHEFDATDVLLAEELGERAGLAIDNARLYTAERRAARRSALLQDLAAGLAGARTIEQVADVALTRGLSAMGAAEGVLGLVDPASRTVKVVRTFGYAEGDLDDRDWWREFPLDRRYPLSAAILDDEPVLLDTLATRDERFPAVAGTRMDRDHSLVCVPLAASGTPIGGLAASYPLIRTFDSADLALIRAIATQTAVALERARLYETERGALAAAEVARKRLTLLSRAGQVLAGSLDYEAAFAQLAELVVEDLADLCLIDAVEGGTIRRMAAAHSDPSMRELALRLEREYAPVIDGPHPVARVLRSGRPEHAADMDVEFLRETTRDEEHFDLVRRLGFRSFMCVPLRARGRILGAMTFVSCRDQRRYGHDDLQLAIELGYRAGVHIDNARLFQERDRIARSLQDVLLPASLPQIGGFELAASYQPSGEGMVVGGDFYDVFERPGGSFGLVIGDVCGKGADAAALMGVARQTIRVAGMGEDRPSAILAVLNEALLQGGYRPFVTVCDVRVRPVPEGARLTVCTAGHPLPLLLSRDGDVREIGIPGTLLGVVPDPTLSDVAADLSPGDALVLYTDGVIEWHPKRNAYEEFVDLLASRGGRPAEVLVADIRSWRDEGVGSTAPDDAAVLVVRVSDS